MYLQIGVFSYRLVFRHCWHFLGWSIALTALSGFAQETPLISGAAGFLSSTNGGVTALQPVIAPVAVVPLGTHLLVESRADLRGFYQQKKGTGSYDGQFFASLEYLQLDYIIAHKVTL